MARLDSNSWQIIISYRRVLYLQPHKLVTIITLKTYRTMATSGDMTYSRCMISKVRVTLEGILIKMEDTVRC